MQRFYRSESPTAGLLGIGWALDPYETLLLEQGDSRVLIYPDQSRAVFAPTGDAQWQATTEPGLLGAVLTRLSPLGADIIYQVRFKDGTIQRYERIFGYANLAGLAAITDRHGNTVTLTREQVFQQNKITRITEPSGRALDLTHDALGRIATITDPIGRVVQYAYDAQGRLSTVTDPAGGITRYTYDGSHRILTITDPRNITFLTNQYDGTGRVSRQTQADGGVWQLAYTLNGVLVTQTKLTDPRGNATTYRFDARGNTLSRTDALGQTTSFDYASGSSLLLSTTDSLGRATRLAYDAQGNLTQITDPAGNVRTLTYEPTFNRVTSITEPLGTVTQFGYDPPGNLTRVTDPLGAQTTLAYNSSGQPTSATDPLGNITIFTYDAVGSLASLADPLGNTTRRTYDVVSRLLSQTDARGSVTALAYDPLNRLTQHTNALGGLTQFSYDANGNLLAVGDARGSTTSHTYDNMDRLDSRTDPMGGSETLQYNELGNLVRQTDRKGQVSTFSYDALNRRVGASYADGSVTTLSYDAGGRLTRASDSVGGELLNSYDLLDRLVAQTTALGTVSYQYDPLGRRTRMDAPNQASVVYGYDAASRVRTITQAPLNAVTLDYDPLGRRTHMSLPNGVSTDYQYDGASQVTALVYRNATGVLGDLSYQYDAVGNRTGVGGAFARTLLPNPLVSANYNAANRQLTFDSQPLTYDLNGNLTNDGVKTYTWNSRNQLVAIAGGSAASFMYDALGRRHSRVVNGVSTEFLYDGLNPIEQAGPTGIAILLTGLGIDEYLIRTDVAGARMLLTDVLGSTVALTDTTGAVETQYTYGPFGATAVTGTLDASEFQYTGRENDGTGLYYYRARYYQPTLHRFISEDPVRFEGGDVNLYSYVFNQPTIFTDPTGEIAPIVAAAVACGAGAVGGIAVVLSGRKPTWGELGAGAAIGCVGGAAVLGAWAAGVAIGAGATVTAGSGALAAASRAAFHAAEDIGNFQVPFKHLSGAAGTWAKFAEGVDPYAIVAAALASASARFLPNTGTSFKVITDLGIAVGTKGQTGVRVVVDFSGKIITAFPVHP
jgi:RHS repeat-associated protein